MEKQANRRERGLKVLPGSYSVCRLHRDARVPEWATQGLFTSVTRTASELSVVCLDAPVPKGIEREGGWRVFKVEGPLDFSLTGVLASLTGPLAEAGIGVFALSTYYTDYLLVKDEQLDRAMQALRSVGWDVEECRVAQRTEKTDARA